MSETAGTGAPSSRGVGPGRSMLLVAILMAIVVALVGEVALSLHHQRPEGRALSRVPEGTTVRIVLVPNGGWTTSATGLRSELARVVDANAGGAIVTGDVTDVVRAVQAGSRDEDAPVSSDVQVEVLPVSKVDDLSSDDTDRIDLIAAITTTTGDAALRPIAVRGADLHGTLTSPSTRRSGLVDLTDLAPTVLAMTGRPVPASMTGSPLRLTSTPPSSSALRDFDRGAQFSERVRPTFIVLYVVAQVAALLAALVLARAGRSLPGVLWWVAALASVPLATELVRLVGGVREMPVWGWSALLALGVGMIVVMSGLAAQSAIVALRRILFMTIAALVLDVCTGSHLQMAGMFGSSPLLGTRYYGFGNPASVILLMATVLWSALHLHVVATRWAARDHRDEAAERVALLQVVGVFLVTTIAVALPGLGADVGGLVTFSLVSFVLLLAYVTAGHVPWKWVAVAAGAATALLAVVAELDYLRGADSRTHLGRLVARVVEDGPAPLFDTIGRKVDANLLGYGFPWSLAVIALAVAVLVGLTTGRWTTSLPEGMPLRIGAVAALGGGLLAFALNDSGVVVVALIAVFLGPFLVAAHEARTTNMPASSRSNISKLEVPAP